jgi:rhamnose transport system permease protein
MKSKEWVPAVLIVAALIGFSNASPRFLDARYLLSSANLYVETGLLALGMTFVIASGNIDLSVGSNMVLTACLTGLLLQKGVTVATAILFGCLVGALLGCLNGVLVAKLKLPSFLVTLGSMAAYRGAAQAILGPNSVKIPHSFKGIDQSDLFGVPYPLLILLVAALLAAATLHRTVFGRWVLALGANEDAAFYAGVPTSRVKIAVFTLTGLASGIGALLLESRLGVARHDLAGGSELDAITVAVVGGLSISGGRGTILGVMLALVLIGLIKTGMGVLDVKPEYELAAIGLLLVTTPICMNLVERLEVSLRAKRSHKSKVVHA